MFTQLQISQKSVEHKLCVALRYQFQLDDNKSMSVANKFISDLGC